MSGFCPEKRKPGGCQLHNLHCRYPKCDQPPPDAPRPPTPEGTDAGFTTAQWEHLIDVADTAWWRAFQATGNSQSWGDYSRRFEFMRDAIAAYERARGDRPAPPARAGVDHHPAPRPPTREGMDAWVRLYEDEDRRFGACPVCDSEDGQQCTDRDGTEWGTRVHVARLEATPEVMDPERLARIREEAEKPGPVILNVPPPIPDRDALAKVVAAHHTGIPNPKVVMHGDYDLADAILAAGFRRAQPAEC